jgi:hypothetical protein
MLPNEMKDSSAHVWKNETLFQQKIKEILPVGAKTKISRRLPECPIVEQYVVCRSVVQQGSGSQRFPPLKNVDG